MKKTLLSFAVILFTTFTVSAQKFAYVDTEYILSNIPSYEAAQDQLDELSEKWQNEVEEIYKDVEKMYKDFQAESVLLTPEQKQKRENAIIAKQEEAEKLQKKYFGPEGELYKKRQELVKPIQDEVFNAVKEVGVEGRYGFIFDTAGGTVRVLYSDPRYDQSDDLLEKLGYKN